MGIQLFEHNQIAYKAAVSMLEDAGKAAVIHPTGTGKSFIGFKLCEEYPDKIICWLSPSSYIFQTQIENLTRVSDGYEPQNIRFFTYAKLSLMSEEDLIAIQPNYIVLDEFHRCGAEVWGAGVQQLLDSYPQVPVLGLSATAIRYLDNQRNMADELFDGNVASEMTLGEAIVRGILNPPKYVLSVYSYQKDLEQYQSKIRRAKNRIVRDSAEQYLEALRRALDQADGLDEIFRKHMPSSTGKYIVFCANAEHMSDMIAKVPEWFSKVDREPHIYSAYSDDPETSREFAQFKADSSSHLKLLFCIDMLNEGVHVDDIDGVILLRPTISPIIYKQQIGRALSANKSRDVVIFDVVMNIANLYSISSVEQEMELAISYYRSLGEDSLIVNERFQIIDEVQDCIKLFDQLNDTLSASWNMMYEHARAYYREHGNLDVPRRFKTEQGHSLGTWLATQRKVRKGLTYGILTQSQIQRLDEIGMRWDDVTDVNWNRNFDAAQEYYAEHGDLDVPVHYVTSDGISLGNWIANLRSWNAAGIHPKYLTSQRKEKLDSLGMIWDKLDYLWERNYLVACSFYMEHRHLDVPINFVTKDGLRLGDWIAKLRRIRSGAAVAGSLTKEQIARLDSIGMLWGTRHTNQWENYYTEATRYFQKHGNLNVPAQYQTVSGRALGAWIRRQRTAQASGKLSAERKARLDALQMIWQKEDGWQKRYQLVQDYLSAHGNVDIPQDFIIEGIWIGKWLYQQKDAFFHKKDRLTQEQYYLLAKLPLSQSSAAERNWDAQYQKALDFYSVHGHVNVPKGYLGADGKRLDAWLTVQRRKFRNGNLNDDQQKKLASLEFVK